MKEEINNKRKKDRKKEKGRQYSVKGQKNRSEGVNERRSSR